VAQLYPKVETGKVEKGFEAVVDDRWRPPQRVPAPMPFRFVPPKTDAGMAKKLPTDAQGMVNKPVPPIKPDLDGWQGTSPGEVPDLGEVVQSGAAAIKQTLNDSD
jgi:hypothetical protein